MSKQLVKERVIKYLMEDLFCLLYTSDSFEVTVQDFKKDDVIPDVIANIIDTNIVTPVSGQGDLNSPVELEVKDVKSEDFTNFVKDLKKGNSKIVDTIETKEFKMCIRDRFKGIKINHNHNQFTK